MSHNYLEDAKQCLQMAERYPLDRAQWLHLAAEWIALAAKAEGAKPASEASDRPDAQGHRRGNH